MPSLSQRITDLASRIAAEVKAKSKVAVAQSTLNPHTITGNAGDRLLILCSGAWGNLNGAGTLTLSYNGTAQITQPVRQGATADRTGFCLIASVTAVASADAQITASTGSLYDVVFTVVRIG